MESRIWLMAFASLFILGKVEASAQESIVKGRGYYLQYCASCHGYDADGRGPIAKDLKASPPDLRYLGGRYGVPLPAATIARFIDGREDVTAHGPRDMPVWGKRFRDDWVAKNSSEGHLSTQIDEIVQYLNAIQIAPRTPETTHAPISNR